jgi:hypothetical protein
LSGSVEEQARWWTYGRQRLGHGAPDAATALREVVGVYSSHPSAPLSLWARSRALDAGGFRAVEGLRVPAMRGAIHLMPADTAPLVFRALQEGAAAGRARLKRFGISEERYAELRELVRAAAGEPIGSRELAASLAAEEDMAGVLGSMTRTGDVVRVAADGLRSNALRYVVADVPAVDPDEGLAWLAGEYLRAFGPARLEDFAWWAGVPAKRARAALDAVAAEPLDDGFLLLAGDRAGFEAATPLRGTVDVLPKWDAYTMGYPRHGRGRLGVQEVMERCYDFRGDGMPVVLVDGAAAATWSLTAKGKRIDFGVEWFERPGAKVRGAVEDELDRVREFLA